MADQYEPSIAKKDVPVVSVNRRRGDRFPLIMNLRFRHVSKEQSWTKAAFLNLSKNGILVRTDRPPCVGATIELVVDWQTSSGIIPK